jgi:hypothetical protein
VVGQNHERESGARRGLRNGAFVGRPVGSAAVNVVRARDGAGREIGPSARVEARGRRREKKKEEEKKDEDACRGEADRRPLNEGHRISGRRRR